MAFFAFATGLTLRRGAQLLEFRRIFPGGKIQFEDPMAGQIYNWSIDKIYREINAGELLIVSGDAPQPAEPGALAVKTAPVLISSLESLPEKYRKELERRIDYITTCKKQGLTKGRRKQIAILVKKIAARREEAAPATSTVMNWWRQFDLNDLHPAALVSGNSRRRRKRSLTEDQTELIRQILRKEYFTRARKPLTAAHLRINAALGGKGENLQEGGQPPVSLATVWRIANEVTPYYRDVYRFGPAFAKNKWRYSLNGTETQRVLQRVEVDHTQLDVVAICDRSGMPLGRPTITVVIDAHSGYVISFFISFWGTGLGPTLNALKIAICPKDEFYEGNPELSNPWLGYGLCELFVVDNGLEFHSPQFQLAAWHLNADVQYCAVRQPWLKPSIERTLGSLGLYLPSQGRVHKRLDNYLPPDPKATAAITFSQICNGLLKYFVDILPFQPCKRTLMEPFEVFKEGFERLPPPMLPSSLKEIDLIGAMSKTLTVGNEGVVFEYLRYNCRELQTLRRNTAHTFKTSVKFHPENLDFVYVQDPLTKNWLMVPSCQSEYTHQLSIVQHRAIRAHLKGQLKERNTLEFLMKGKLELIELYDGFLKGNRGKKSVKAAQQFGTLTSTQTLTEGANEQVILQPQLLVSDKEFEVQKREIPKFESFILD